jgi:hypothetical protein
MRAIRVTVPEAMLVGRETWPGVPAPVFAHFRPAKKSKIQFLHCFSRIGDVAFAVISSLLYPTGLFRLGRLSDAAVSNFGQCFAGHADNNGLPYFYLENGNDPLIQISGSFRCQLAFQQAEYFLEIGD